MGMKPYTSPCVTPIYNSWRGMKRRCQHKDDPKYIYWGGRGITFDPKWLSFEKFKEDMGASYQKGLCLDRINNDGNYCKENCRWATGVEQNRNRRTNRWVTFNGKTQLLIDWAQEIGVKKSTLYQRFYVYKWPLNKTLTKGAK